MQKVIQASSSALHKWFSLHPHKLGGNVGQMTADEVANEDRVGYARLQLSPKVLEE